MTEVQQRNEDAPEGRATEWVVDKKEFGRELKIARLRAGMDSAEDLEEALWRECRYVVSADSLWAIERGKYLPNTQLLICLIITLQLEQQILSLHRALRPKLAAKLERIVRRP